MLDKDDNQHVDAEKDPDKLGEDVDIKHIDIEEPKTGLRHCKYKVQDTQKQNQVHEEERNPNILNQMKLII